MLRTDLEAARRAWLEESDSAAERIRREKSDTLVYVDEAGRVFDFHALRHQFITNLARSGVSPKEAQVLARHSTITLTMDRYTHLGMVDLSSALDRLPSLPSSPGTTSEGHALKATGTDDAAADRTQGRHHRAGRVTTEANPVAVPVAPNVAKSPVLACPALSPVGREATVDGGPGNEKSPEEFGAFEASWPVLTTADANSGAGTRTPDTRIMIPLL